MIIGTLGPEGSFTEKAAKQWNDEAELRYYDDIYDVVDAILQGEVDNSVVPIENSQEGSIAASLDLLEKHELKIVGEVIIQVKHCLLSKGKIQDIKIVMSHPQALSQCREYIKNHFKTVEVRSAPSTSHAAKHALTSKHIAAIASKESSRIYGLEILDENIQDVNNNFTRFVVIGKNPAPRKGNDKTSIILYLKENKPGALHEILREFAINGINLTKIESRPTKRALGDYLFYIDLKGHIEEEIIKNTLANIKDKVEMLKILGSYPVAIEHDYYFT
jgi:prephenate dehydratase